MATDMHLKERDIADPSARGRNGTKRSCVDCHTIMTPCWRGGPAGPRTLCNACGIRYRKRRAFLDLKQGVSKRSNNMKKTGASGRGRVAAQMKQLGLMGFKGGSVLQQQHEEWKRKMGEEERAAILLMALSSGSNIFVPVSI